MRKEKTAAELWGDVARIMMQALAIGCFVAAGAGTLGLAWLVWKHLSH